MPPRDLLLQVVVHCSKFVCSSNKILPVLCDFANFHDSDYLSCFK